MTVLVIKIPALVGIFAQIVELVLVLVAQTKFPSIGRNHRPRGFIQDSLNLLRAREFASGVNRFLARRPLQKNKFGPSAFTPNKSGPALTRALRVRRFA